ncbi:hypothetical protein MSIMFB_01533 [Mycobacterium simulans]|uniref:Uncharacterized protein n=1 Tax=Mycobacterium simulans TaxID=627089 RepID=A0A7Z7N9P5_9MYCO|nr:hypothetical protein MSIMFB_01533 [Mycobacterium simulans]
MLEQVGGLCVDLERILFVEQIDIEQLVRHMQIVIQTDTNNLLAENLFGWHRVRFWRCDYNRYDNGSLNRHC